MVRPVRTEDDRGCDHRSDCAGDTSCDGRSCTPGELSLSGHGAGQRFEPGQIPAHRRRHSGKPCSRDQIDRALVVVSAIEGCAPANALIQTLAVALSYTASSKMRLKFRTGHSAGAAGLDGRAVSFRDIRCGTDLALEVSAPRAPRNPRNLPGNTAASR